MNINRRAFLKRSLLLMPSVLLFGCDESNESTPANIEIQLPYIVTQPLDKTVFIGNSTTFQVLAGGAGLLSYQWRKDTVNLPDATSSTYTTPPLELVDTDSSYSVVVVNENGFVISHNAILIVNQPGITADLTSVTVDSTEITIDGM